MQKDLLQQIAAGDETALSTIWTLYKDKVYSLVLSYVPIVEEAEEITQDVFVEVYRSAHKYEGRASVYTWVYRIAVNKSLDHLRFKKAQKRSGIIQGLFFKSGKEPASSLKDIDHPGISLERTEDAALLFNAIQQLPPKQQTAFILTQIQFVQGKEAAEIMNMSVKAIESLIQRAKVNLRNTLGKEYPYRRKLNDTGV